MSRGNPFGGVVGPLLVVVHHPPPGDFPYVVDAVKQMGVEHLLSVGFVEAFDKGVLGGFPGLDVGQRYGMVLGPLGQRVGDTFGAVVHAVACYRM